MQKEIKTLADLEAVEPRERDAWFVEKLFSCKLSGSKKAEISYDMFKPMKWKAAALALLVE